MKKLDIIKNFQYLKTYEYSYERDMKLDIIKNFQYLKTKNNVKM